MPPKIPYLGHQSRLSEGRPPYPSAYVGTSVIADRTRLRIMPAMHYACFAPFWRFGKSRWVGLCSVHRLFLLARANTSMKASASLLVYARASQLERESAPIGSIESSPERIIFLSPRCVLFRLAHRRVHHRPSLRFVALGDSISVIAVVLEINRKQWGSHAALITVRCSREYSVI